MTSEVTAPTIREQLIEGGLGHVRREGVGDLTVRTLAKVSGRSTMCVYTKFGARSALVTAIYEAGASELLAALDRGSQAALLTSMRRFAREERGLWDLLLGTPPAISGVEPPAREALLASLVEAYVETARGAPGTSPETAPGPTGPPDTGVPGDDVTTTDVSLAEAAIRLEIATALGLVALDLIDDDAAWEALTRHTVGR